ncbi:exosome component 4-like Rrp41-like, partial [Chondrus crispus]
MFASPVYRSTWKGDGKSTAAALVMQKAFEGVILTAPYPKSQIDIYLQVLQNDGGALVATVNAASLALVNVGVAMSDFVVACGVGFVDDTFVVDPSSLESASDRPELTLAVLSHSAKIASCQLDSKLPDGESFERALEFATSGANQIFKVLEYEVRKYSLNGPGGPRRGVARANRPRGGEAGGERQVGETRELGRARPEATCS